MKRRANNAPAPNRRPRFPLGGPGEFEYPVGARPASPAAVGEAQRWLWAAARTCRKSAGLKMYEILGTELAVAGSGRPVVGCSERAAGQGFARGCRRVPRKKGEGISVELGKKNQGRTYNFKPAVLMHFRSAADIGR
jgi:hypothetical protein